MLMPSKVVKPIDSLFSISAYILKTLGNKGMTLNEIHEEVNKIYLKEVTLEKIILCLNFLYTVDKIRNENEVITAKI